MKDKIMCDRTKTDDQMVCIPLNHHSLKIKKKRSASEHPPLFRSRLIECLEIT